MKDGYSLFYDHLIQVRIVLMMFLYMASFPHLEHKVIEGCLFGLGDALTTLQPKIRNPPRFYN